MPAPLHGQVSLSGTPGQLDPTSTAGSCKAFTIKAPLGNAARAFIGSSSVSSSNGYPLDPGDEISYERLSQNGQPRYEQQPNDFYVTGSSGDIVGWLAFP